MYKYATLIGKITAAGDKYSPRLHKQKMPFMVLNRLHCSDILQQKNYNNSLAISFTPYQAVNYLIRDVRNSRKKDKETIREIWTPAFNVMSNILTKLGAPADYDGPIEHCLRHQLADLGFDPILDSFYGRGYRNISLQKLSGIFSRIFRVTDQRSFKRLHGALARCNNDCDTKFSTTILTIDDCLEFASQLDIIRECADKAGRYYATVYFRAFPGRFMLSDTTVDALEASFNDKSFNTDALLAVYNDLETNVDSLEPQEGITMLFIGRQTGYTSVFG